MFYSAIKKMPDDEESSTGSAFAAGAAVGIALCTAVLIRNVPEGSETRTIIGWVAVLVVAILCYMSYSLHLSSSGPCLPIYGQCTPP